MKNTFFFTLFLLTLLNQDAFASNTRACDIFGDSLDVALDETTGVHPTSSSDSKLDTKNIRPQIVPDKSPMVGGSLDKKDEISLDIDFSNQLDATAKSGGRNSGKTSVGASPSNANKFNLRTNKPDPTPTLSPIDKRDEVYSTTTIGRPRRAPKKFVLNLKKKIEIEVKSKEYYVNLIKNWVGKTSEQNMLESLPENHRNGRYSVSYIKGGLNQTFLYHTNELPLHIKPGSAEHIAWAKIHGENLQVPKFPIKVTSENVEQLALEKMREEGLYKAANQTFTSARLNGKQFIEVAELTERTGFQRFVAGDDARKLRAAQERIIVGDQKTILYGDNRTPLKMNVQEAKNYLIEQGFVNTKKELDLELLDNHLNAAEEVFIQLHDVGKNVSTRLMPQNAYLNPYRKIHPDGISSRVISIETQQTALPETEVLNGESISLGNTESTRAEEIAAMKIATRKEDIAAMKIIAKKEEEIKSLPPPSAQDEVELILDKTPVHSILEGSVTGVEPPLSPEAYIPAVPLAEKLKKTILDTHSAIGFDFLFGKNVIWSKEKLRFIIIDI